ncbi:hypothetical protein CsSME_00023716 [Camellia sinensis var. sinensis]
MEAIEKCDVMVYMKIFKFPYKFWHCGPEKEFFIYAHEWRGCHTFWPSDSLFNDHGQLVPQRPRPPPFFPENHHSVDNFGPFVETQRTAVSPPVWGNQAKLPGNFSNSWTRQEQPAVLPYDFRKKICNQECGCSGYKNNQVPTYTICV